MAQSLSSSDDALNAVVGDYLGFIATLVEDLKSAGMDVAAHDWEMDHICYRTATTEEYRRVIDALVPSLGSVAIEGMIGGRPIATIELNTPIEAMVGSRKLLIPAIEVPAPKPGAAYTSGLEHAELAIGSLEDGIADNAVLTQFMERQPEALRPRFDLRGYGKELNADVALQFGGGARQVKFHSRPLLEVIKREIDDGFVVPVPADYFSAAPQPQL